MNTTKQILSIYFRHAWRYKQFVIALLAVTPLALLSFRLFPPLLAANIVQRLSDGDYIKNDVWGSFGPDLIVYTIFTLLGGIVAWRLVNYLIWKLEGLVVRDLARTMFNQFMRLSSSFHADNFGGSLVSQTNKFIGSYIRLADSFIYQFYTLVLSIVFICIIMWPKAPAFVWAILGFSVLFVGVNIKLSKHIRELGTIEAKAQNRVTGYLADAVTNVMAIKSFSARDYEEKRFNAATENVRQRTMDLMRGSLRMQNFSGSITSSVLVLGVVVSVIAVVVYGASPALVLLMFSYSAFIGDKLWEFSSSTLRNYNRAIGDAQEAVNTLQTKPSVADPPSPEEPAITQGSIVFRNVLFDHEDLKDEKNFLFNKLNLSIQPGEKIGLVGHSGGGKTTITKLLLRFMDIDDGEILIDGQNIARITQDTLRSSITYVPQEPLLFHRTLSENIGYGKPSADQPEIEEAAQHAHAHEFIKDLPKGYDTLVGERGVKLSGGQRQRVAIARAMIKDAPILVLDEATSALDSESEKLIQDALWKLMEGKTAIVIAHRLSTVQKMDRIIVLNQGKIVEEGSHTDLLKKKGAYAKLWAHQSGGFLEE